MLCSPGTTFELPPIRVSSADRGDVVFIVDHHVFTGTKDDRFLIETTPAFLSPI